MFNEFIEILSIQTMHSFETMHYFKNSEIKINEKVFPESTAVFKFSYHNDFSQPFFIFFY